jgi:chromosome condensin MukBEF complex kleisin-like MukF subunit
MDPGVIAVFIPIVATGGFFAWMISLSPVGKAYAERMRSATKREDDGGDREELRSTVEELRREVAELAERVDFTERLLAKQQTAEKLPPGS